MFLEEVKKYLSITWNDEITNSQIGSSIKERITYLERIIGYPIDFDSKEIDSEILALLKDYCRYVRNYSLEYFETNFRNKLIGIQMKYATNENKSGS